MEKKEEGKVWTEFEWDGLFFVLLEEQGEDSSFTFFFHHLPFLLSIRGFSTDFGFPFLSRLATRTKEFNIGARVKLIQKRYS